MSSKNSISRPLDYVEPARLVLKSTSIDSSEKIPASVAELGIPRGVKLVNAMALDASEAFVDNEEQIISDKDLQTMATNNITDISEYGNLTPSDINDITDTTTFPTLPTTAGAEIAPIVDNVSLDTKEIKAKK